LQSSYLHFFSIESINFCNGTLGLQVSPLRTDSQFGHFPMSNAHSQQNIELQHVDSTTSSGSFPQAVHDIPDSEWVEGFSNFG